MRSSLLRTVAENLAGNDIDEVKKVIFLVASAALGYGIAGPALPELLGMGEDDLADFPRWMAGTIGELE